MSYRSGSGDINGIDKLSSIDPARHQSSAAAKVLNTFELLESILPHAYVYDVWRCQKVANIWHNVISENKTIQKSLFCHPVTLPQDAPMIGEKQGSNPILGITSHGHKSHVSPMNFNHAMSNGRYYLINPFLDIVLDTTMSNRTWSCSCKVSGGASLLWKGRLRWDDMLLIQPPMKLVHCLLAGKTSAPHQSPLPWWSVHLSLWELDHSSETPETEARLVELRNENGVTIGDLVYEIREYMTFIGGQPDVLQSKRHLEEDVTFYTGTSLHEMERILANHFADLSNRPR